MVGKNKKRLEITLADDEYALLESLSSRFNISKSSVIKQALKVFASKRKHGWTTWIQEANNPKTIAKPQQNDEDDKETWDKIMEEIQ